MQAFTGRYFKLTTSGSTNSFRYLLLFLCLFVFSIITNGQIKFERLAANKNFSSKYINDIVQDTKGYLIIATNNGVYRFDGYSMKKFHYDPDDSTALNEIVFSELFIDSNRDLWVGGEKLYFFDQKRECFVRYDFGFKVRINTVYEYDKENLVIVSAGIGIFNIKSRKYSELKNSGEIGTIKYCCFNQDNEKNVWISGYDGKVSRLVIKNLAVDTTCTYTLDYHATCFYQSFSGKMLLGTSTGIILEYDKSKDAFFKTNENELRKITQNIRKIFEDRSGTLWIVCENGLYSYNNKLHSLSFFLENINDPNSLNSNYITCFHQDKYGVLWIGTTNGICSVNPNARNIDYLYKRSNNPDDLPSNNILSIYKDDHNFLWLATDNGILSVDPGTHALKRYLFDPVDRRNKQILFHHSINYITGYQNFLLLAGQGINKVDFQKGIYQYAFPEKANDTSIQGWTIRKIVNGREPGTFLIIPAEGGITKVTIKNDGITGVYKMEEGFHRYNFDPAYPEKINSYTIWDVYEDKKGRLWIGSDHGLFSFDPYKKSLIKYPILRNLKITKNYIVRTILEDKTGNLWIGTEGFGLNKLVKDSFYLNNVTFPGDVVWGILDDSDNNLWISTCKGLIKYNPKNESIRVFDETDGLLNEEFIFNAFYKDNNGKMYFGSASGLISFYPQDIESNKIPPDVWINELYIFNKIIKVNEDVNGSIVLTDPLINTEKINLSYKHKVISIGFSGIHLQSPANNRFAYYLEGFDKDWTYTNADVRKANYTNLPAGKYKFWVKAANADGVWSKERVLLITVHPPFWKTRWFRMLIFIILLGGLVSFYFIRINRIKAQNLLLEKLVKERTLEVEQQKEELAVHAENMEQINILLKERNEEVISQSDELTRLNATKDKFFSIIAHDLKNPFQAITGLSDLLLLESSQFDPAKVREFITMIRDSSVSASSLLQNLLQWSRNQTNSIDFNPALFDLQEVARDIITLLKLNAEGKNITLQNNVSPKSYLFADRNMIHTVIRNLVNNAIKYTPNDGTVSVSSELSEDHFIILVKDNGVGMDEEMSSKLFRIEKNVSTPGTMGEAGTGLGLIICKDFIVKNNGGIRVESQPGQGTTFIIQLPLPPKDMKPEAEPIDQKPKEIPATPDISVVEEEIISDDNSEEKPVLLVIDDEEKIRVSISNFFAKKYLVFVSPDGKDGYEKAISECPDMIISDINMPEMNGFELCEKLKTDERTSHIPVILLTANTGEIPTIKGYETGADDYLTKPFNLKILTARIKNLLDSRKKLRELYSKQFPETVQVPGISKIDQQFLDKVHEVINTNISNSDFSADALADKTAMSRQNLYRKIRALTNCTVHEYIKIIRLKKAAELIRKRSVSVSEVAFMVGFNDRTYFSTSFKKLFGKSPSDYLS